MLWAQAAWGKPEHKGFHLNICCTSGQTSRAGAFSLLRPLAVLGILYIIKWTPTTACDCSLCAKLCAKAYHPPTTNFRGVMRYRDPGSLAQDHKPGVLKSRLEPRLCLTPALGEQDIYVCPGASVGFSIYIDPGLSFPCCQDRCLHEMSTSWFTQVVIVPDKIESVLGDEISRSLPFTAHLSVFLLI